MTLIWNLNRGELFKFAGHILEFERMDGMYARAWTRTGQLISVSGYVEVI
jgi:hypothetical protein